MRGMLPYKLFDYIYGSVVSIFCRIHVIVHFSPVLLCDKHNREPEMLEQNAKLSIAIRFGTISVTSQNVVTNKSTLA